MSPPVDGAMEARRTASPGARLVVAAALLIAAAASPPATAATPADPGRQATTPAARALQDAPVRVASVAPGAFWMFTEPQRTMADVYYGGRLLLSTPVRYTLDTVEFLDAEQVIKSLPNTLAPSALLNHFQGEIPTNAALICTAPGQPEGCGKLEPDFIGVIFDESRFRADVFVHPDLLATPDPLAARYLPPPTSEDLSLVQGLGAVVSDSENGDALYGLYGQTWIGDGRQRVFSFWNSTDRSDFSVGQLAWQRDYPDNQLTAGLFESQFGLLRVMRRDPIAGVGFRRSLDTRLDIEDINGGDIQVFLANRSQVDILRDGRLLTSGFYEAGNQRIDSSRLPPGAYTIELRITDSAGQQRTITRFFVKSSLMAPANHPLYFAELGRVLDRSSTTMFPEDAGTLLGRGGYQWRHSEAVGLSLAGAATEDEFMPELGAVWVGDRVDVGGEIYASTRGDTGAAVRGSHRWKAGTLSLVIQHSDAEARPLFDTDYHLVPDESVYIGLSASQALWSGLVTASMYRSEAADNTESDGWSLGYSRSWRTGSSSALNAGAQLGAADSDMYAEVSLQWRFGHGNWQHTLRPILRESEVASRPDGAAFEAASVWQDNERFIDDLRAEFRASVDKDNSTLSFEGEHASEYGMARLGLQSTSGEQDNGLVSAMADTNIVATSGEIGFGSAQKGAAGLILDLRGVPADSLLDVLVDGRRQFTARGGRRVAVALPAYRTYRISLRDRGTANYSRFEQDEQEVTLYPGNAVVLDWKIQQVVIVLGRLYRNVQLCDGLTEPCEMTREPMAGAVVRSGKAVAVVEDNGFFQLEMDSSATQLEAELGDSRCTVAIDGKAAHEGVLRLPVLECLPVIAPEEPAAQEFDPAAATASPDTEPVTADDAPAGDTAPGAAGDTGVDAGPAESVMPETPASEIDTAVTE